MGKYFHTDTPPVAIRWTEEHTKRLKNAAQELAMNTRSARLRHKYDLELKEY